MPHDIDHREFSFCAHCGGSVDPYEASECENYEWRLLQLNSPVTDDSALYPGVVTYWCESCNANWIAHRQDDTFQFMPCSHFRPLFAGFCPVCGSGEQGLNRCAECNAVLSLPDESCQNCGHVLDPYHTPPIIPTTPGGGLIDQRVENLLDEIATQSHFEDRYQVGETLAQGGMGQIVRAFDRIIRREVAIKMMHAEGPNASAVRGQFLKEAHIGGRLLHPHILSVFDVGVNRSRQIYYTMRLVDGASLQQCLDGLNQGAATKMIAFPLRKTVSTFKKVCEGVDFAHQNRVLHLDLKPHNTLISGHSEVFVIDWGLARVDEFDDTDEITGLYQQPESGSGASFDTCVGPGGIVGTPGYMAPEQARGETSQLNETTDVYGLGGILYFILFGRAPNTGRSLAEILMSAVSSQKQPGQLRQGVLPRGRRIRRETRDAVDCLQKICLKSLALEQQDRFDDTEQLIIELDEWLTQTEGVGIE